MAKEIIETIINGAALTLISYGVQQITTGNLIGYLSLLTGMILEFAKYYGRKKKFWK